MPFVNGTVFEEEEGMKLFPILLAASILAPFAAQQTTQAPPKQPVDPAFEGCIAKGPTEGVFLLQNARAVAGTIVGTGLRFRLVADNKGINLTPHVNHVVQVTGPVEGQIPAPGKTVPDTELPQLRVKVLSMISSECIVP